ncbi:hypothetical protein EST38_g14574 [Candolleomyces aberdarensis]|uniref:No apical meristem-associated C-terminal domain-containing protein n=1 Tax=Candolleomyces aberdarensis TaxID=2316362 RepID=A0A4Q2CZB3_9AGAR|nr:hypothetical protein EST38_g14574 [Candolleomyces aberdarensis]
MPKAKKADALGSAMKVKKSANASDSGSGRLSWAKNLQWTDTLVTYLTTHPTFCVKLFSDSNADAAKDGRSKSVGKDHKHQLWAVLAKHIFLNDPAEKDGYKKNPTKYVGLWTDYQGHVKTLKQTGAGIPREDITPGSELANLQAQVDREFPWFEDFHSFWKDLPNYNPIAVTTSLPGADHAANAAAAFCNGNKKDNKGEPDPEQGGKVAQAAGMVDEAIKLGSDGEVVEVDDNQGDDEEEEQDDDVNTVESKEKAACKTKPGPAVDAKPLAGRDLGLSKGKAAKTNQSKHRRAFDNVNDYHMKQSDCAACKQEMEHELAMEKAKAKRLKYELKAKQADADREAWLSEIWEQQEAQEHELKLQLELLHAQAAVERQKTSFPPTNSALLVLFHQAMSIFNNYLNTDLHVVDTLFLLLQILK